MLAGSRSVFCKDFKQLVSGGSELLQAFLLGLLLIFVFSLSRQPGQVPSTQLVSTIFWLVSAFALVLIANVFYRLEEHSAIRFTLLLAPVPAQSIWFGKCAGIFCLLFVCQLMWFPLFLLFLGVSFQGSWIDGILLVFSVDFGLAVLGSLLGTFAIGREGRDALLTVLCFPLLLPLLLGAISLGDMLFSGGEQQSAWWGLILAFDALFTGAALLLFPFAYTGE